MQSGYRVNYYPSLNLIRWRNVNSIIAFIKNMFNLTENKGILKFSKQNIKIMSIISNNVGVKNFWEVIVNRFYKIQNINIYLIKIKHKAIQ